MGTVKRIWVVLVVVLSTAILCSVIAWSQTISVDGEGMGTLVAVLSESGFTASLQGGVQWTGEAAAGETREWFSAEGNFRGIGVRSILSLLSEAWLAYSAEGSTADGTPAAIWGLLHFKRVALIPLQAGDLVVGTHYTLLDLGGETYAHTGEFLATATGEIVPSEAPLTLRLVGTASVHLSGGLVDLTDELLATVPLDHPALTPEFLQYVEGLFALYRP